MAAKDKKFSDAVYEEPVKKKNKIIKRVEKAVELKHAEDGCIAGPTYTKHSKKQSSKKDKKGSAEEESNSSGSEKKGPKQKKKSKAKTQDASRQYEIPPAGQMPPPMMNQVQANPALPMQGQGQGQPMMMVQGPQPFPGGAPMFFFVPQGQQMPGQQMPGQQMPGQPMFVPQPVQGQGQQIQGQQMPGQQIQGQPMFVPQPVQGQGQPVMISAQPVQGSQPMFVPQAVQNQGQPVVVPGSQPNAFHPVMAPRPPSGAVPRAVSVPQPFKASPVMAPAIQAQPQMQPQPLATASERPVIQSQGFISGPNQSQFVTPAQAAANQQSTRSPQAQPQQNNNPQIHPHVPRPKNASEYF